MGLKSGQPDYLICDEVVSHNLGVILFGSYHIASKVKLKMGKGEEQMKKAYSEMNFIIKSKDTDYSSAQFCSKIHSNYHLLM